ncbi:c-type cytochrome [soil metagenome]
MTHCFPDKAPLRRLGTRKPASFFSVTSRALLTASLSMAASLPLRAAPQVEDSIAQRVQACTGCHGPQGRAAPDGYYPRIAGKPAGYLYNQLLNFRDGRREYSLMSNLLAPLSDAYLREIAEHFASLDLPYPPHEPTKASVTDLSIGEALATRGDAERQIPACVACHGQALTGVAPGIPGLMGLPRDYINGQLGAWKAGNRKAHGPDCMAQVAKALTPQDISAVSSWLSALPLPADTRPADSLPAALPILCGGLPGGTTIGTAASGSKP